MRYSRRFINFAPHFCVILLMMIMISCKGRTRENMVPTGDTIEVVIMQDTVAEFENN